MSALTTLAQTDPDAAATLRRFVSHCWDRLNFGDVPPYAETLAKPDDPTPTYDQTAYHLGYTPTGLRNAYDVAQWRKVMAGTSTDPALERPHIPARPLSYQARARRTDPATSHEAARSVRNITKTHELILRLMKRTGPVTDEELLRGWTVQQYPRISPSGLRTRRHELEVMGKIVASPEKGRTAAGRSTTIWKLTDA